MKNSEDVERKQVTAERQSVVEQIEDGLQAPALISGFIRFGLMIYVLIWNLTPAPELTGTIIWIIFILNFTVKFVIAPDKSDYPKASWITALSLLFPTLRVFRVFRVFVFFHAARRLRLFRVLTSLNRGMWTLGESFARRGFGNIVALSMIITFALRRRNARS